ncbi:MAG: glycosyltransferase [Candidatus Dadabacteria bacterium]|nr:MAG: glycosyltransferase [Candidatus Dadabacteria bacterium]
MDLSIVVPVYNERDNLEPLHREIRAAVEPLGRSYEIIYVDDGSTDGSREVLRRLHAEDPHVHVIGFRRNFGQTAAVAAGLQASRGEVVVTLDGDLQNDPADIPRLLDKLAEGYDLVSGWRRRRQDAFLLRRLPSVVANWIIRITTNVNVHDYGCMLKAYRGEIARGLRLYGEMHRFIPAIAGDLGARIAELEVNHRPRIHGSSKYGLSRTIRVVLDLLTVKFLSGFSTRPIHVFGFLGLLLGGAGTVMLGWLGFEKIVLGAQLGGRPIVLLAILLAVLGVQFVTMGLLGEMLARTYHESQNKPIYVVGEDLPCRGSASGQQEAGG